MISYLCGDDAQAFIDVIDEVRPHSPSFPSRSLITSTFFGPFVSEFPPRLIRFWISPTSHHGSGRSACLLCAAFVAAKLCFQDHCTSRFATIDRVLRCIAAGTPTSGRVNTKVARLQSRY